MHVASVFGEGAAVYALVVCIVAAAQQGCGPGEGLVLGGAAAAVVSAACDAAVGCGACWHLLRTPLKLGAGAACGADVYYRNAGGGCLARFGFAAAAAALGLALVLGAAAGCGARREEAVGLVQAVDRRGYGALAEEEGGARARLEVLERWKGEGLIDEGEWRGARQAVIARVAGAE